MRELDIVLIFCDIGLVMLEVKVKLVGVLMTEVDIVSIVCDVDLFDKIMWLPNVHIAGQ